jgi:hypothetical protein
MVSNKIPEIFIIIFINSGSLELSIIPIKKYNPNTINEKKVNILISYNVESINLMGLELLDPNRIIINRKK